MKKAFLFLLMVAVGLSAMAQQKIQLHSTDRADCVKSDMRSLKASFSFSTIEAENMETKGGQFSWLSMANTVIGGNEGDPQIPVVNELIAVPFGAQPTIRVTSYSSTDYKLNELGIERLVPRQPSLRKDQDPEKVPFVYNESAYQTRGLRNEPSASVYVDGIMRGIQLGTMTIEPVSYDPVNNTLRVFNDIEVEVSFDDADVQETEDMLLRTYSPAFNSVYNQLFNNRAIMDVYTDHPDMYNTPVRMLVICYSGFQGNSKLNEWLQWKLQKGYYVDIYYTGSGSNNAGTTASAIASFIKSKYNASVSAGNAYTYLIVIGDTGQVPQYMTKTVDYACASDLGYSSVNFSSNTSNYFPDMYYSRISVENTTHLTNYLNKVLTYERFEFTDGGNYLNNVILVGGWDSNWTPKVAKPTINYATNNYFKSSNTTYGGFESGTIKATISTSSTQGYSGTNNGCYQGINNGACFVNYTAHGDRQEWSQPNFTATQVATLTNTGKYFFGVGNCCLTGNFNNTSTSSSPGTAIGTNACFAETMIRVPNAGAIAYVGCSPYSYWYEDFYWAVGAHSYSQGNAPSVSGSSKGVYDVMFADQYWNSASALMYLGNLAVQQAVTNGNTNSSVTSGNCNNSAHYYFQFYHTFGDGSVMPYITKPETNTVTIPSTITPNTASITVHALAGSYVAVTDNSSVIYGVGEANSSGIATVNFTESIPNNGTLYVVITRQQYQPYYGTINVTGTQYTITASANPSNGGTVSGAGTYYQGTQCTLTATPNTGYSFTNWKKGNTVVSTEPSYTFEVTGNATYTATFTVIPQYTIGVSANPTEGGTVSGGGTYYENTQCTLTAETNEHYEFIKWTKNGSQVSTNPSYTFTVTAAGNYVANFNALAPHTVTCNPVENGTISASPTTAYKYETVTLSATPAAGYFFSAWDVRDANNNSITVEDNEFIMPDSDVTVNATFVPGHNVTLATPMNGSISADPMGGPQGTTINLTATPDMGYVFDSWIVYKNGDLNTTVTVSGNSFTMPAYDVTVVGIFTEPQGGDVTIGSGTTTNNGNFVPMSVYYEYSLTQQIYTAEELGDAANIIAISFYYNNTTASDARNLNIYMSHTSSSTITAWSTVSSSQLVYSGSHTFTEGWNTLTLTTPFTYDGTSNILLTVDDNTGTTITNGYFRTYSTGANRAIYYRNQNTNPDPTGSVTVTASKIKYNPQMIVTKAVPSSEGYLCVTPNSLSGFETVSGSEASESQSVAVIGANLQNNLTVTMPAGYEVCATINGSYANTLTLTPTDGSLRQMIYVRLASNLTQGDYVGDIAFTSGTTTATVSLNGVVTQPAQVTQTVNLTQGWSWWSTNLNITLDDLKAALVAALPGTQITIKSQNNGSTVYYVNNNQWRGSLNSLDITQMYEIYVNTACTITMTGAPVDPSEHPVTVHGGVNWIGFPHSESMTLNNAFDFTPVNGDIIKSKNDGSATYNNGRWRGGLTNLQPGQGYIYVSKATN